MKMQTGINISGGSKEAVDAVGGKILDILKAGLDYRLSDETIQAALRTLHEGVSVRGMTISGCSVVSNDTWITPHPDDDFEDVGDEDDDVTGPS